MIPPVRVDTEFVTSLNDIKLKEEEIVQAINAAVESSDSGECHFRSSVVTTMQLFPAAPQKARAIIFRLQALSTMMQENELNNWMLPDGSQIVPGAQKALIAAVAHHPLSLIEGAVLFEKRSFLGRILEFSETQPPNLYF